MVVVIYMYIKSAIQHFSMLALKMLLIMDHYKAFKYSFNPVFFV